LLSHSLLSYTYHHRGRKKTFAFDTTGKLSGGGSAVDSLEAELNLSSFFGD
jgi:hypothetical protein